MQLDDQQKNKPFQTCLLRNIRPSKITAYTVSHIAMVTEISLEYSRFSHLQHWACMEVLFV